MWVRIEHLLPGKASDHGVNAAENRQFLEVVSVLDEYAPEVPS